MSSILISTLALGAVPALAAEDRLDGSDEVSAALERDLGLSPEEAKVRGELQARAIELDAQLQAKLGDGFAGSEIDPRAAS